MPPTLTQSQRLISERCDAIKAMLLAKNRAYGDSALKPLRVFSKASPIEQILVRIDDKLSRLSKGHAAGEDVLDDLIGYLVILQVATAQSDHDFENAVTHPNIRLEDFTTFAEEDLDEGGYGAP